MRDTLPVDTRVPWSSELVMRQDRDRRKAFFKGSKVSLTLSIGGSLTQPLSTPHSLRFWRALWQNFNHPSNCYCDGGLANWMDSIASADASTVGIGEWMCFSKTQHNLTLDPRLLTHFWFNWPSQILQTERWLYKRAVQPSETTKTCPHLWWLYFKRCLQVSIPCYRILQNVKTQLP